MAAAFDKSPAGQRRNQELQSPYEPLPADENALVCWMIPQSRPFFCMQA